MNKNAKRPLDDRGAFGAAPPEPLREGGLPARVAVIYGGPSPEHDVSILTGLQAVHALSRAQGIGSVRSLYWSKSGDWYEVHPTTEAAGFLEGVPSSAVRLRFISGLGGGFVRPKSGLRPREDRLDLDAILICCHGGPGEDGSLQGALDLTGLHYSGPTAIGAALGMDKLAFGALMVYAGLPALSRVPLTEDGEQPAFAPPYILKPRFGGSSIGIEVVADFATARARLKANPHLRRGAVLEPYHEEMFDLQLAARSWPDLQLSAIERPLRTRPDGEILGYQDKYVGAEGMTSAPRELPAKISPELDQRIRTLGREAALLVGLRGVARLDFLSDGEDLFINEINTIPGSLAHYLWIDPRLALTSLLLDLLTEAVARPAASYSTAGSDGSVLRVAGTIASKLG
jgi:D-alanine-D-alanine ligase